MNKEISIKQFIQAIQKLPFDERREQWIRWLSEYHTPGYYQRLIVKGRNAKFAYNHVANPKMLLWLIQAAGVSKNLVKLAKFDCNKVVDMHQQSAAIRKHVPWEALEGPLQKLLEKEATHWLQYWKPFQIEPAITEPWLLNHSAGNQLGRVKPGDIVWIISVEPPGRLITLGPIYVQQKVRQRKAEALIGPNLWPADWHIVDTSENAHRAKRVDLSPIASRLRFVSQDFPILDLKQGKVSGTQFQQMRKLEPESAELISRVWYSTKSALENIVDKFGNQLDDLASLDEERSALVRREQGILRRLLFGSDSVGHCGICGREYPVSLLVAAHVKPRAQCSDLERRDTANNLIPLCLLGCDPLFEQGFISVDKGCVVFGPNEIKTKDLEEQVGVLVGSQCRYWSRESKKYFDWRAKHPVHIG